MESDSAGSTKIATVQDGVIRQPHLEELSALKALIDEGARMGSILPRTEQELTESIRDFFVCEKAGRVVGCCALHLDSEDLAEVRSLLVDEAHRGQDIGARLVEACIAQARAMGVARIYALTRIPKFFERLGFYRVEMDVLPIKVFKDCLRCHLYPGCDELAVMLDVDHAE